MTRAQGRFQVDGRPSRWLRCGAMDGRPLLLFAHGAGAAMDHRFMEETAAALDQRGLATARFHFPYMERKVQEGRARPPDRPPLLIATWRRVLELAEAWKGRGPLFAMGKSLGGRMASMMLAEGGAESLRAAIYLGYPLHPAGKPERLRDAHLDAVPVPQLFVQGSRDALCERDRFEPVLARLTRAREFLVEGGDHSLARRRSESIDADTDWLRAVADFVQEHAGPA